MLSVFNKPDADVQREVLNELKSDPSLKAELIFVNAIDGLVILQGSVHHHFDRTNANAAALRVGGVREVVNELRVDLSEKSQRTDENIAKTAVMLLDWNYTIPKGIKVEVRNQCITLKGETEWAYQRNLAEKTVSKLKGVAGVCNRIKIRTTARPANVKFRIESALKRAAKKDARKIIVSVEGDKVVLTGEVNSFSEMQDARLAAWSAPGVVSVENKLTFSH